MYQYIHWFCISGVGCWHRIIIHINRFRCVYFLLINYIPFIQLTPKWITRNCNACDLWRVLGGQSAAKSAFWFLGLCENKDSFLRQQEIGALPWLLIKLSRSLQISICFAGFLCVHRLKASKFIAGVYYSAYTSILLIKKGGRLHSGYRSEQQ